MLKSKILKRAQARCSRTPGLALRLAATGAMLCAALSCGAGEGRHREFSLPAGNPEQYAVRIANTGRCTVFFTLTLNGQRFNASAAEVAADIQSMPDAEAGESIVKKVWRYVRDRRYHDYPLGPPESWFHNPGIFFNTAGIGWCDAAAAMNYQLWTQLGYKARVWDLAGHMVAEVFRNGRWEMYDADEEVYYHTADLHVAGVEELAASPGLISNPVQPVLEPSAHAYSDYVQNCYATQADNVFYETAAQGDAYPCRFTLPPGALMELPAVYAKPLLSSEVYGAYYEIGYYANLRLTIPAGWRGRLELPLILQAASGSGSLTADNETWAIGSQELAARLRDRTALLPALDLQADSQVQLVYVINPLRFGLAAQNSLILEAGPIHPPLTGLTAELTLLPEDELIGPKPE